MIFSTFNQLNTVFVFLFFSIICGLIFNVLNTLFLIKFSKKIKKTILFSIIYAFFSCFFVFLINIFNFGKLNFVLPLVFILGFVWVKNSTKNLFVFFENKWYTNVNKFINNIRKQHASKSKKCKKNNC